MIYLLHFSEKFKQAGHYLGSTEDVVTRIHRHRTGSGSRLAAAVHREGIEMQLVRVWAGSYEKEYQLKALKNNPCLCPICNQKLQLSEEELQLLEQYNRELEKLERREKWPLKSNTPRLIITSASLNA